MTTLKAVSRQGRFNILDTSQVSTSIHLAFTHEGMEKYVNLSFDEPPEEPNGFYEAEDATWLIDEWEKKIWISTQRGEVRAFKTLVLAHAKEICEGNKIAKLDGLRKQRDELNERITKLETL